MRALPLALPALGGLLVGLLLAGPLLSGTAGGAAPSPRAETLAYGVVTSPFRLVDVGEPGPGVGDQTVFDDRLILGGKTVGAGRGACTITHVAPRDAHPFRLSCVATYELPGGTVAAQGSTTDAPTKALAVVGGTGRFAGVGGELAFVEHGDGRGRVTLRLAR